MQILGDERRRRRQSSDEKNRRLPGDFKIIEVQQEGDLLAENAGGQAGGQASGGHRDYE